MSPINRGRRDDRIAMLAIVAYDTAGVVWRYMWVRLSYAKACARNHRWEKHAESRFRVVLAFQVWSRAVVHERLYRSCVV